MKVFDDEWAKAFCSKVNSNENYAEAGKTWEGDFIFIIKPSGGLDSEIKVTMLQENREGKIVTDGSIINQVPSKSEITFYKSNNNARFVRLKESYYNKLEEKIFKRG